MRAAWLARFSALGDFGLWAVYLSACPSGLEELAGSS